MNSYTNVEQPWSIAVWRNILHVVLHLTKRKQKKNCVSRMLEHETLSFFYFFCSCTVIMFTQGDLSENFNLWIRYREVKLTWIQQSPPVEISALKVRDILYAFCNFSPPDCIKVKDDFFSSISKPELTISWWELSKSINFFPTIIHTIFFPHFPCIEFSVKCIWKQHLQVTAAGPTCKTSR